MAQKFGADSSGAASKTLFDIGPTPGVKIEEKDILMGTVSNRLDCGGRREQGSRGSDGGDSDNASLAAASV